MSSCRATNANRTSRFDTRPRVGKAVAAATPPAFREVLLGLARSVRDGRPGGNLGLEGEPKPEPGRLAQ